MSVVTGVDTGWTATTGCRRGGGEGGVGECFALLNSKESQNRNGFRRYRPNRSY